MAYDPSRYLRYEELTAQLREWATAHPALMELAPLAESAEGRTVWGVTLTNQETGPAAEKPGYLVDGNTHAGELLGGAAAIYTIHWLLTNYGVDARATELLDTRVFYVIPRVSVDGTERYLRTPEQLRSSPKRYPEPDAPPGLYPEDIDGNGLILQMRVEHPDGDWKADDVEPRLLVQRQPEDRGEGPYYKLYTEGMLKDWDGKAVPPTRRPFGLDFNRNYPAFWNPEGKQPGAGPYPLSEPETRAVAEFVISHPNIGAYVAYHTTGGVLLRPPSNGGDDKGNEQDLAVFKQIGELCTRLTGHPCKSTFQAFNFPGQEALVKGADDWAYEHRGVMAYTFELYNHDLRAGNQGYAQIGVKGLMALKPDEVLAADRKKLTWNDATFGGKAFANWTAYDHPQLGRVEIGGWDSKHYLQNPPEGAIVVDEVSKAALFTVEHACTLPRLAVTVTTQAVGAGIYKVSACVKNLGGLATNVTHQALTMKTAPEIEVTLAASGEAAVVMGKAKLNLGHLEGYLSGPRAKSEVWTDWLVQGKPGAVLMVTAKTARAGTAMAGVTL